MTDRALTENELRMIGNWIANVESGNLKNTEADAASASLASKLLGSHRLQAARIQELEKRNEWLNECLNEENADRNAHD